MKKTKKYTLPPMEFSNAINFIYKPSEGYTFDFTDWENSKEWRLFNAGRESALYRISTDARMLAQEYAKIVRA